MSKRPIVFTGLSLSLADARTILPAEIRPPVRSGDLDQLADGRIVAIIDGVLDADCILSIGEIRRALERGIKLLGAASLGALRAHETRPNGMEGYGWVYEAYCSGRIVGTEEISVIFDPLSCRPLTIPLVNVRYCLEQFARRGAITDHEARAAMTALKAQPMEERNCRTVLLRLAGSIGRQRLKTALSSAAGMKSNIKQRDALQLLDRMAMRST
jgi:hypothetical protein